MHGVSFAHSPADLARCVAAPGIEEVLLEPALLARQGRLDPAALREMAAATRRAGLRAVLCWDTLLPQRDFAAVAAQLEGWDFEPFAAVRVRGTTALS